MERRTFLKIGTGTAGAMLVPVCGNAIAAEDLLDPLAASFKMVKDVKRGIYVLGRGSYSIDQQRSNFKFGGQLYYEIRDGKIG